MTSAGYADLLAKIPAGADWIVADALEVEPIDPRRLGARAGPAARGDRPARRSCTPATRRRWRALIEGLVMSGLAMQAASSSRPASGAEHQFSHLWEMEGLGHDDDPPLSHGFKVGLGSIAIVGALRARARPRPVRARRRRRGRRLAGVGRGRAARPRRAHTTPGLDEAAVEETRAKYVDARRAARAADAAARSAGRSCGSAWPSSSCPPPTLRDQLRGGRLARRRRRTSASARDALRATRTAARR